MDPDSYKGFSEFDLGRRLPEMVRQMVAHYVSEPSLKHIDRAFMPSRSETEELIERLLELVFPGFYGRQDLTEHNVAFHVGELLPRISLLAFRQIYKCLCYQADLNSPGIVPHGSREQARSISLTFLDRLARVRDMLSGDVLAAYDGDPAAINTDEVILAYPGLLATAVYRLAHELYAMEVPLLPRMMTEWAHAKTGVDIHPGARIGPNFFIDHGTGVVIGETTEIGRNVKVYQGVTLGALSIPKDEVGRVIRGTKRHPTVEEYVTIYANAIVLGGDTRIGAHSVIGGSVFLTSSVPPYCTVTLKPPELRVKERNDRGQPTDVTRKIALPDYQI